MSNDGLSNCNNDEDIELFWVDFDDGISCEPFYWTTLNGPISHN